MFATVSGILLVRWIDKAEHFDVQSPNRKSDTQTGVGRLEGKVQVWRAASLGGIEFNLFRGQPVLRSLAETADRLEPNERLNLSATAGSPDVSRGRSSALLQRFKPGTQQFALGRRGREIGKLHRGWLCSQPRHR